MAATVESAFVLIDRASGTIRELRRELRDLEADARKAGLAMDEVSGPRVARQMQAGQRDMRALGQGADQTSRDLDNTERSAGRLESRLGTMRRKTRDAHLELGVLGKVISALKWPLLIAGVGGAIQALGGLAGGAVALLPKLLDLSGAAAGMGALFVGAAGAMGVVKLATHGLTQAFAGNQKAIKSLTPEARGFLQMLRQMRPELASLRRTAQAGLFPGVGDLLRGVRSQLPAIKSIVGQSARDLGGIGTFLGQQLTMPGFMRDLKSLAGEGSHALGDAARGGFYFAQALEQVLLAAQPFVSWLGQSFMHLGKLAEQEALAGKETGRLGSFFDRTRQSIQTMWDVGKNVFGGLRGVMEAARGTGDSLWGSIDKVSKRFDDWANSVGGQASMRRWFDDMRPVLHETVGLLGDLGRAIGSLTQGQEGAQMMRSLRDAVPSLVQAIKSLTTGFGPAAIGALGSVVKLLGDMSGEAGPLTLVARSIGTLAHAADVLVKAMGPFGSAIAQAAGAFLIFRKMNVFNVVDQLRAKWMGVTGAAREAAVAEREATAVGTAGGVAGAGAVAVPGVAGAYNTQRTASGLSVATEAEALAAGGSGAAALTYLRNRGSITAEEAFAARYGAIPGARFGAPSMGELSAAADTAGASGRLAGLAGGLGSKALGVASKFALPLMALQGALAFMGTQGNFGERTQGALSGLTLGLVPGPVTGAQRQTNAGKFAGDIIGHLSTGSSLSAQRGAIGKLQQNLGPLSGLTGTTRVWTGDGKPMQVDVRQATQMLQAELKRRQAILAQSQRDVNANLDAESIKHAQTLANDFANAFGILKGHKGPQAAMRETVSNVLDQMRHMRPAGAKVLDESMISWAQTQAKNNPKLRGQMQRLINGIKGDFSDLHKHVTIVNGLILTGTKQEWNQIGSALTSPVEKATEEVTRGFTTMQQVAIGELTQLGYTSTQAKQLVTAIAQGLDPSQIGKGLYTPGQMSATGQSGAKLPHRGHATGGRMSAGRIPGTGTLDTVKLADGSMGAPGEIILNRHTEADIDRDLRMAGRPSLEQRVRFETRPHSAPPGYSSGLRYATGGLYMNNVGAPGSATGGGVRYSFPFGAGGWSWSRTDQGQDFGGNAPVGAIGPYRVTYSNPSDGWYSPAPAFMVYELTAGADAGKYIYVAEHLSGMAPAGSTGSAGQAIAQMTGGIEMGWAAGPQGHQIIQPHGSDHLTAAGQDFHRFLMGLTHGQILGGHGGAIAGMGVGPPPKIKALKGPRSKLHGLPGAMSNQAGRIGAGALTSRINQALAVIGLGGGAASGTGGGSVVTASWFDDPVTASGHAHIPGFAELSNPPGSLNFSAMGHLPMGELVAFSGPGWSRTFPKVDVGAGGSGLGGKVRAADFTKEAADQIPGMLAAGLMNVAWKDTGQKAFGLGGRMADWAGWHARGTDVMVNRPTVFGAGENGPERVKITPGGGSSHPITIHRGAVQVNTTGGDPVAIQRYVDRRLEQFAREVADEIAAGEEVPHSGVIA